MPRITWQPLFILLFALPLASCSKDESNCPTCPPENSGQIRFLIDKDSPIDSAQVWVDGGASVTVPRPGNASFTGLSPGVHTVHFVRWYGDVFTLNSRSSSLQIRLERGETRTIIFQFDFPRVVLAPRSWPAAVRLALAAWRARSRAG